MRPTIRIIEDDGSVFTMDIDEYVKGVLPYEMGTGWPIEALKAQAVAAKSYALACRQVYTDTRSQVFGSLRYEDTNKAVDEVQDIYLTFNDEVIAAFFFAHCNGSTRSPSAAGWNPAADRPYLMGVECPCGRDVYYGHGIGMCQRGAQAMALDGKTFEEILQHYYPGTTLSGMEHYTPDPPPANASVYVVQPDDSLSLIGKRLGIPWEAIFAANRHLISDPALIEPGWQLIIPRAAQEDSDDDSIYVVQPDDTLGVLALRWGTTVDAIARLNGISNPDLIRVGQRLRKPQ